MFPLRNTKPPPYLLFGGLIKRKHVQITMIDCEKFVLISVDLTAWLLLLCNDVEKNPGPKSRRSESQPAKPSKQEAAESRQTNRKFDMLEKHLTKLEKELLATRRMGKTNLFCFLQKCPLIQHPSSSTYLPVEKQTTQIENLVDHTRGKDRVETEVMKLQDDIVILKETTSIQPVIAKRHQSGQSVPQPLSAH